MAKSSFGCAYVQCKGTLTVSINALLVCMHSHALLFLLQSQGAENSIL